MDITKTHCQITKMPHNYVFSEKNNIQTNGKGKFPTFSIYECIFITPNFSNHS